jgi:hypothetical protein
VRRIYEAASLAPPEIVWVASPLAIAEQWLVARRRAEEEPSDASRRAMVASVRGNVRRRVPLKISALERQHVHEHVRERVSGAISEPLDELIDEIRDAIWARVVEASTGRGDARHVAQLRYEVGDCYRDRGSGQHDAAWLGCADFYGSVCGLPDFLEVTSGLSDIAQSAGWFSPQWSVCWIAEPPSAIRLEEGRLLETENTPALVYRDGFSVRPTSRSHASR